jgi:hypothetical protein
MVWQGPELAARLSRAGDLLAAGETLWRSRAFHALRLPWETALPELSAALRRLTLAEAEALAADNNALATWLAPLLPIAGELHGFGEPGALPAAEPRDWPEPWEVPGRKWAQIRAFVAALEPMPQALPTLEWCAGKGHLGRHYCQVVGVGVTGLEWDAGLVAEGNRLSARARLPVRLEQVDVLSGQALPWLEAAGQVLALHACGDLHRQLLKAMAERPRGLALAPCCYHRTQDRVFRPLSALARRQPLRLTSADLKTAVQESVTAPARVQAQRRQLQAWRLGFDLLQREVRGVDDYLPVPSLPPSVLREGFAAFCQQLAQRSQLALPGEGELARFEAAGLARLQTVAALDLPRLLFRRLLELWLVLDQAEYLRERGFGVRLGTFCERHLTPRNLLILARPGSR